MALSAADKKQGRFVRIDTLELSDKQVVRGCLKRIKNMMGMQFMSDIAIFQGGGGF